MTCTPEQAAAADVAIRKGMGQHIPDEWIQSELPIAAQMTYAKHTGTITDYMVSDAIDKDKHLPVSFLGQQLRKLGVVDSWITENLDPQDYLGRHYTQPLLDALQAHREALPDMHPDSNADPNAVKRGDFDRDVLPVINHLQSMIQDRFNGDHARINYANQWLEFWSKGGSFYREPQQSGAIQKMIDTTVGNLVGGNPFIAVAHTMQITPKAIAIYGPEATLKGIGNWTQEAIQAGTIHLPDLIQKGALRAPDSFSWKLPFDGMVNLGDNIGRGMSYHIAEAAKAGSGMEGVHNISYVWQPGREPMVLWSKESAMQVALQRYAISGAKMYGGWLKNIYDGARTGDTGLATKGAAALVAFSITQSIFTGTKSAMPAPLYHLLPQDARDQVDTINESLPHLSGLLGRDMSEHYQPVGGIGFGIAANLINEDFKGGYAATKASVDNIGEGDIQHAAVNLVKAGLVYSQPLVPGSRLTYKKLWDALSPALTGDSEWSDVPEAAAKKLGFPAMAGNQ